MEKYYGQIINLLPYCRSSMSPEEAREYNNILVDALNEDETAFSNDFYDFAPVPTTPRNMVLGPYFYGRMPSSVVKVMRPQQKDICLLGKYLNWQGWDRPKLMRACAMRNGGRRAFMMQSCFVSPVSYVTVILSQPVFVFGHLLPIP
ncbi:hypothetical protein ACE6H2_015624 [Prunus campanulata]